MKNSEFKERFFRTDSLKKPKKKSNIPFLMIFVCIVAGGLPFYFYMIFTGEMFELDIVKKFFNSPDPEIRYKPFDISKSDKPQKIIYKRFHKRKIQNPIVKKKSKEFIYSWEDNNGVKQFSNVSPSEGSYKDLVSTKAINSSIYETPVRILNNQIFIPIKLGYHGKEISTVLLLDTGATHTSIHQDVANNFNIYDYKRSQSIIADGSIINTKYTIFDYIIVGSYKMKNFRIGVIDYKGGSKFSKGLLGMNFLKNTNFHIDYSRQVIKW